MERWIDNGGSVWRTAAAQWSLPCQECGARPAYYCENADRQGRTGVALCATHLSETYGGGPSPGPLRGRITRDELALGERFLTVDGDEGGERESG